MQQVQLRRHPEWIRAKMPDTGHFAQTVSILRSLNLHTVCEEAECPNRGECYAHRTATFMILGNVCTRRCSFCAVTKANPQAAPPDPEEPARLAEAVVRLGLQHVVITSVNRDDLPDQGAGHFAACVCAVKSRVPEARIEVLIPDFRGARELLRTVVHSPITVLNHNVETVPRLYPKVRPGARYDRSVLLLYEAKRMRPDLVTKTGLMLGMGETADEIRAVLADLREVNCDVLTLGQYLSPSAENVPVARYVHPTEFAAWGEEARAMGFAHVESGPLVRSSYHAWSHVPTNRG